MQQAYPILEFDPTRRAVIEPAELIEPAGLPERCVICFFQEVLTQLVESGRLRKAFHQLQVELCEHPFYALEIDGQQLTVFHPGVGASLAAGLLGEAYIAKGGRTFIACGGAGVRSRDLTVGHLVVPTTAIRDEGTSYHYAPPAREAQASDVAVRNIEAS